LWNIYFDRIISPEVSRRSHLFLRKAIINQISSRIIEVKGIHARRKEGSQTSVRIHFSEYLIYFGKPFFFGILFIQDTIGLIFQSHTSQTKRTVDTVVRVKHVGALLYLRNAIIMFPVHTRSLCRIKVVAIDARIKAVIKVMRIPGSAGIHHVMSLIEMIYKISIGHIV
jgi:hypothetical protein